MGRHEETEIKLDNDANIDKVIEFLQASKARGASVVFIDRRYYDQNSYEVEMKTIRFSTEKEDRDEEILKMKTKIKQLENLNLIEEVL